MAWATAWKKLHHTLPEMLAARTTSENNPATRSLFGEILDWMLAPLLLLWPLSIAITYLVARSIANVPFDQALDDSTTVLAQQVKVSNNQATFFLPMSARDLLRADDTDNVYFQVRGRQGELLAGEADLPLPTENPAAASSQVQFRNELMRGQEVRVAYLWLDILPDKKSDASSLKPTQPVLIQVAETLDKRKQLANEIIKGVTLPQFAILPIAVVLVWLGLSRGIRPLAELQQRIRLRRPDDFSTIDERQTPEEIVPLVNAFNELLQRLEQSVAAQKRFIADAAHQMKTPLAGLRMQTELALRSSDTKQIKLSLQLLAQSTERSTRLINQLLVLARAESDIHEVIQFHEIELNELVRSTLIDWLDAARNKAIDLGAELCEMPVRIMGNPLLLHELLGNLIDNALRYSPPNGMVTVRVAVSPDREQVYLEVEDNGIGIPLAEREMIFERFYRVLPKANLPITDHRHSSKDGSGLGLAIVREIASQHNAQITVRTPKNDQGICFCISFPALKPAIAVSSA